MRKDDETVEFSKGNTIRFPVSLGLNLEPHARKYCVRGAVSSAPGLRSHHSV